MPPDSEHSLSALLWLNHPLGLLFSRQNPPSTLNSCSRQDSRSLPILGPPFWVISKQSGGLAPMTLAQQWTGYIRGILAPQPCFPILPLTSTQCRDIANNHRELRRLGITHVLNASHSRWRGTPESYEGLGIRYLGVEAHDSPAFDMSIHFQTAADFIHRALSQPGGKILVHCAVGVSRSATLVLAYLMLYHHLTLVEAIKKVKDHRGIIPNRGFLRQLLALDRRLRQGLEA
ncbi:dual specificity protein phosphatase 26 isoform X1 [Rhinolophus sinicus]|uniref:dual specificity protein phosphatase 26 isoform X1 n=1 Tax=Rhinolophus sinicus TaxID=89399 RepID=UPI003D7B464B